MTCIDNGFGMRCPNCRASHRIDVAATVWVRLCQDGTDTADAENGDHEWNNDSAAVCHSCGHSGAVKDFEADNAAHDLIPWQLAKDHETYGDDAGKWIITTANGEQDIGRTVYATREACEDHIALLQAGQAVIDAWETRDLAAAVRNLDAAVKSARRPR